MQHAEEKEFGVVWDLAPAAQLFTVWLGRESSSSARLPSTQQCPPPLSKLLTACACCHRQGYSGVQIQLGCIISSGDITQNRIERSCLSCGYLHYSGSGSLGLSPVHCHKYSLLKKKKKSSEVPHPPPSCLQATTEGSEGREAGMGVVPGPQLAACDVQ